MTRFALLFGTAAILISAQAFATAPAEPLAPLSPTKDKSAIETVDPSLVTPEETKPKSRRKTFTSVTRINESSDEEVEVPDDPGTPDEPTEPTTPDPGVKGQQHAPSKGVEHKSARDPANHEPYVPDQPYKSPYDNR